MTRVLIIARTHAEAQALAEELREEGVLEIVDARSAIGLNPSARLPDADVVLMAQVSRDKLPIEAPPLVMLVGVEDADMPFSEGVGAILSSDTEPSEIAGVLIAVAHNFTVFDERQRARWLPPALPFDAYELPAIIESLTRREQQVLRMLANGLGNKEIGKELGISDHTAKFHVAQILAKLRAGSRAEAVAVGIRRGLLPV